MYSISLARSLALLSALVLLGASSVEGQGRGLELSYARWWHDGGQSVLYSASLHRRVFGLVQWGLGMFHRNDSRTSEDRTQTGGDLTLSSGRGKGLYVVGSLSLGIQHSDGNLDGAWSVGAGYMLNLLPFLRVSAEARYRVEDRDVRGFWRLNVADRRGLQLQAGITIVGSARGRPAGRPATRPGSAGDRPIPSGSEIAEAASDGGLSDESAALAGAIVATALAVMGTPYEWGGTDENGFDCSGLIQYSYGEHGILLPRVSRDQARIGMPLDRDVDRLLPGDILAFSVNGNGISHVGLYVGDGRFIHSSSSGVKLSDLTGADIDGRWWRARWVGARRVLS